MENKTTMRAVSGLSFQFKNQWYKLAFEEERTISLPSTMELGKQENILDEERKKLWEKVNSEVDNQMLLIVEQEGEKK